MIETVRDPQAPGCQGGNCPGIHIDRTAGTVSFEGPKDTHPTSLTTSPVEGFVTWPLDVARRIVAEADGLL